MAGAVLTVRFSSTTNDPQAALVRSGPEHRLDFSKQEIPGQEAACAGERPICLASWIVGQLFADVLFPEASVIFVRLLFLRVACTPYSRRVVEIEDELLMCPREE